MKQITEKQLYKEATEVMDLVKKQSDENPLSPFATIPLVMLTVLESIEGIKEMAGEEAATELFGNIQAVFKKSGYRLYKVEK